MNINLIRTKKNLGNVYVRGDYILECYDVCGGEEYRQFVLFDPAKKEYREIVPGVKKYSFIPVINCMWDSKTIYFATYTDSGEPDIYVDLYQYDTVKDSAEIIYSFKESRVVLSGSWKKIKVFILNENTILFQTETLKEWNSRNLMGSIAFSQVLVDPATEDERKVSNPVLVNNGVDMIYPVSENQILIKTGYSNAGDNRITGQREEDALIESVYIGTTSQFISYISIENSTNPMKMLGTAYFEKFITMPQVRGDYVYFCMVDQKKGTNDVLFYNYKTGAQFSGQTVGLEPDDPDNACIIKNTPYARRNFHGSTEFINMITQGADYAFVDEEYVGALENVCLFNRKRRGKNYLRGYDFIRQELLFEERGFYLNSCTDGENTYIYVSG